MKNLKIFETNILDGSMEFKTFFNDHVSNEFKFKTFSQKKNEYREIKNKFFDNYSVVGERYGFDASKVIIPVDDRNGYKKGDYFIANFLDGDFDRRVHSDIVLLKDNDDLITIAYPVNDDPVLIACDEENKVSGLVHLNIDRISEKIPLYMLDAFDKEFSSSIDNLKFYISSNLKEDYNTFLFRPKIVCSNYKIWKKFCNRDFDYNGDFFDKLLYRIDMEGAIKNMLLKAGVKDENVAVTDKNTYTDPFLFSKRFLSNSNLDNYGKFLVGAYYGDNDYNNIPEKGKVRSL